MKRRMSMSDIEGMLSRNPHLAALNSGISPQAAAQSLPSNPIEAPEGKTKKLRSSPQPKTRPEVEMNAILGAMLRRSEIASFEFEGITLIYGDGARYTADFAVFQNDGRLRLIEVKGPFIRRTGLQALQSAKAKYKLIRFELWQLTKGEWKQLK